MNSFWKRIWTEINLDNLIYNYNTIKQRVSKNTQICCVVKANAYGHHAPKIALTLEQEGAEWFAVSNIEEAIQLREEGLRGSIIILGYTPPECASTISRLNIVQCVYSLDYAKQLSACAAGAGVYVRVHIKIDTGMGRIGFQYNCDNVIDDIESSCSLPHLCPEGIFTHFALSDSGENGKNFSIEQFDRFKLIVAELEKRGISFEYKHCSNSAATIDYPNFQMNMVRVGIALYGLMPSAETNNKPDLKPVMSLKTVVSHVKNIKRGDTVSYGCDFVADSDMKIATVPMGYADGFWRANVKNSTTLLVHGQKARIVGRICMDQLMLDVTNIEGVALGDEVTVFGDADGVNTADDLASSNGTVNYEVICSVGKRVPRVFIKDSRVDGIHLGMLDTTVN